MKRKKVLIILSIITLSIACFILVYYFQRSLIPTFFPPKTYSLVVFNPKSPQKISQGDTLTGRSMPNSTVKIFLSSIKEPTETKTTPKGDWSYSIASTIKAGLQRLTIMILDQTNQIASIKSYPLKIAPVNLFGRLKEVFRLKNVKAQETQKGADYANWVTQMQAFGIYPAEEDGEIVLYNEQQFKDKYCNTTPCMFRAKSLDEMIAIVNSGEDYLDVLLKKLYQDNYSGIDALLPYIPEIDQPKFAKYRQIMPRPGAKLEIGEETLRGYIQTIFNDRGIIKYYADHPQEHLMFILDQTDPIFGFSSLIKFATLPPYRITDEERLNAFFGLTLLYGLTEKVAVKGFQITSKTILDFPQMINDTAAIRRSLKIGETIPVSIIEGRAKNWAYRPSIQKSGLALNEITEQVLKKNYKEKGFDAKKILHERQGAFVELGGPTLDGYELVDVSRLDRRLYITNIDPRGCPIYNPFTTKFERFLPIDFQADATNLRFAGKNIGALFVSCLPHDIRSRAISEATRVLEDGGLLIWQNGTEKDILDAVLREGLIVKESRRLMIKDEKNLPVASYNIIFQKPSQTAPEWYAVVHQSSQWQHTSFLRSADRKLYDNISYVQDRIPIPPQVYSSKIAKEIYATHLQPALMAKRASVIDPINIVQPIVERHIQVLNDFIRRTGRPLRINETALRSLSQNNYAYIIGDEFMPSAYGMYVPWGNYFIMSESIYKNPYGLHVISHELIHAASDFTKQKGWRYGGTGTKDRLLTGIFELMTDVWSDLSRGINIYSPASNVAIGAGKYPEAANLTKRIIAWNPKLLDDLLEFAITADSDQLIAHIFGYKDVSSFMDKLFSNRHWAPDYESFVKYFKNAGGINLQAIAYTSTVLTIQKNITSDEEMYLVEPAVEFGPDFITDDYDQNQGDDSSGQSEYSIIINQANNTSLLSDQIIPTSSLNVSALVSSKQGVVIDTNNLFFAWSLIPEDSSPQPQSLTQVKTLTGGERCKEQCQVTLPADLNPGNYNLVVYLVEDGDDQILASDSYPITVETLQTPVVVSSMIINGNTLTSDILDKTIPIHLNGTEGKAETFNIPFTIHYNNKNTRYLSITFNYQPLQQLDSAACDNGHKTGDEWPECRGCDEGIVTCNGGNNYGWKSVRNPSSACGLNCKDTPQANPTASIACPAPYPQCGGTIGLEDYPKTDTILVTPKCDGEGEIIEYQKQNLGDRGECQ